MLFYYHNIRNTTSRIIYTSFLKENVVEYITTETYLTLVCPLFCPGGGAVGCKAHLSLLAEPPGEWARSPATRMLQGQHYPKHIHIHHYLTYNLLHLPTAFLLTLHDCVKLVFVSSSILATQVLPSPQTKMPKSHLCHKTYYSDQICNFVCGNWGHKLLKS